MSRRTAAPNEFLERVVLDIASRERARRTHAGETCRPGGLGIFADLMGGVTKQAVSYWITTGGVPHKHAPLLRKVLRDAGVNLAARDFKRLMPVEPEPAARGGNDALQRVIQAASGCGVPVRTLARHMGMSYWQLHRAAREQGGLQPEGIEALANALHELGVPAPPGGLAACVRPDAGGGTGGQPRRGPPEAAPAASRG